jgi:hypothetical protein
MPGLALHLVQRYPQRQQSQWKLKLLLRNRRQCRLNDDCLLRSGDTNIRKLVFIQVLDEGSRGLIFGSILMEPQISPCPYILFLSLSTALMHLYSSPPYWLFFKGKGHLRWHTRVKCGWDSYLCTCLVVGLMIAGSRCGSGI